MCATPRGTCRRSRRRFSVCRIDYAPVLLLALLAAHRLGLALARTGIGLGALASHGQTHAMAAAPITADLHQAANVRLHLTPQIALDPVVPVDAIAHAVQFLVGQIPNAAHGLQPTDLTNLQRSAPADAKDVGQGYFQPLVVGEINSCYPGHVAPPRPIEINRVLNPAAACAWDSCRSPAQLRDA